MATIVQGTCDSATSATAVSSFVCNYIGATTDGNLLVAVYGARDEGNNATPTFDLTAGWTKVGEATPMEFHTVGIAWRVADGTAADDGITVTATSGDVQFWWCGVLEFNQATVSAWALDASSFDGSGATNTSSIATGSTGTLSDSTGAAVIVGTSRTGSEGLSSDVGTSLDSLDTTFVHDAGSANFLAYWLDLAATTALNATVSESSGSSRMGAGIAVFVEAGGAGGEVHADAQLSADATVSGSAHRVRHADAQADGTATVTASAHVVKHADARIAATATLAASAHRAIHVDAQADGAATLDGAAHRARHVDAQLDGNATLSGSAHVEATGGAVHIDAQLSATATVDASAHVVKHTTASIAATATLTATVHLARHATAELAGTATLQATAHRQLHADAQIDGVATLVGAAHVAGLLTPGFVTVADAAPTVTLAADSPTVTLADAAPTVTLVTSKDAP